jgi:hypothetical protein
MLDSGCINHMTGEKEMLTSFEENDCPSNCDRTTSEMRGLSPKIILGDSRRSDNAQTHTYKHIIPYMKFKLSYYRLSACIMVYKR